MNPLHSFATNFVTECQTDVEQKNLELTWVNFLSVAFTFRHITFSRASGLIHDCSWYQNSSYMERKRAEYLLRQVKSGSGKISFFPNQLRGCLTLLENQRRSLPGDPFCKIPDECFCFIFPISRKLMSTWYSARKKSNGVCMLNVAFDILSGIFHFNLEQNISDNSARWTHPNAFSVLWRLSVKGLTLRYHFEV